MKIKIKKKLVNGEILKTEQLHLSIPKVIFDELNWEEGTLVEWETDLHLENGKEFLRGEIEEKDLKMKQKYIDDSDYIMKWWKPKAIKRYSKLFDENRLKPEKLFYGDIVGKTWEETKEMYLSEVGR